jgi:NAD(P)-dependent dehydrogenase (short-subunit alcohol dehydrogenase family)
MDSMDSMDSIAERLGLVGRTYWIAGGGGGGIGTSVAVELARAGANVVALDRDADALALTESACEGAPGNLEPVVLDALDRTAVEGFVAERQSASALADGLVNIIGGMTRDQFERITETPDETFDAVLRHNTRAAWLVSQTWARSAINAGRSGSVVHLSSIAALQGMPFGASYSMAKAALISLARTQALEWGAERIRVNTIAAGTIKTPRATHSDAERDRALIPLGRRGTPKDISGAALFLLSDLSEWVTGQVLAVDGGASIKPSYLGEDGLPAFVQDDAMRARLFDK